jgi:hypothetical protein
MPDTATNAINAVRVIDIYLSSFKVKSYLYVCVSPLKIKERSFSYNIS